MGNVALLGPANPQFLAEFLAVLSAMFARAYKVEPPGVEALGGVDLPSVMPRRAYLNEREVPAVDDDEPSHNDADFVVTLSEFAPLVHRAKSTLRKYDGHPQYPLPEPVVKGGGGRRSEYSYRELRAWAQRTFGYELPERPPAR